MFFFSRVTQCNADQSFRCEELNEQYTSYYLPYFSQVFINFKLPVHRRSIKTRRLLMSKCAKRPGAHLTPGALCRKYGMHLKIKSNIELSFSDY